MHMADALLSPAVGATMYAVSAAANTYAVVKTKRDDIDGRKIPLMGVMGAFVFAAQMINFTIPATGSSGHIGGGILLAAMIGGFPALLTLSAVLLIQCLFFADGGLLALGCNIFNMGVIPCLIAYPLLFKPLVKKGLTLKRITVASLITVVAGLQLGAFCVVLQTRLSGISELPFESFVWLMQPIHLAIGVIEGLITASVLCFVYKMRPEIMECNLERTPLPGSASLRRTLCFLIIITVLTGGVLSFYASQNPDGLEWAIGSIVGDKELEADGQLFENAASIQEGSAFMPDYDFKNAGEDGSTIGTGVAGLVGGGLTFLVAAAAAWAISAVKRRRRNKPLVSA